MEFIDRLPNGFCRKRNLVDEFGHGYRMTTDDLEDAEGTYVYVKLAQVPRTFQWQTVPGKLHSPQSNRLEEVGVETRPLQESPPGVSLTWCRNLCAMSRLCGCFVYSDVTKKCERFANCQRAIIDPIPRVHTIRGINGELPTVPDYKIPDFHYWIYYKKAEIVGEDALFLEERSCWPMILWAVLLASCCWLCLFLILRVLGRKDRLYEPLEGLPDYNIVLENASKVSRWPGSCGRCGCACGRPPFWIPSVGAVVVLDADEGLSPRMSSLKGHPAGGIEDVLCSEPLQPADVVVSIGKLLIHYVHSLEEVLKSAESGERLELVVLRPRRLGRYRCRGNEEEEHSLAPQHLDLQQALETHEKVVIELFVP